MPGLLSFINVGYTTYTQIKPNTATRDIWVKKTAYAGTISCPFRNALFTGPLESFTLAIPKDLPDSAIQIVEIFVKSPVKVGAQSGFGVLTFQKPASMFTRNYSLRL